MKFNILLVLGTLSAFGTVSCQGETANWWFLKVRAACKEPSQKRGAYERAGLDRYSELSSAEKVYVDQLVASADHLKSAIINVGAMIDQRTAQERLARQAALARQAELDRQQNGHH
ncbi:unnamed protein product [Tilletia laevis]|uniref:Uncharacterized protein n=2 Tax=Tilletia TaxID=13289 RepID=A0A8X7SUB9_9BASI|nr:hypothetical protein A4X06_0g7007 [Tilletia controversa]CAD6948762.1 unnamed protein product [Tilletia controversa]CAD6963369.1 unnamed protein product [Tilletia laevis]